MKENISTEGGIMQNVPYKKYLDFFFVSFELTKWRLAHISDTYLQDLTHTKRPRTLQYSFEYNSAKMYTKKFSNRFFFTKFLWRWQYKTVFLHYSGTSLHFSCDNENTLKIFTIMRRIQQPCKIQFLWKI